MVIICIHVGTINCYSLNCRSFTKIKFGRKEARAYFIHVNVINNV